MRSFRKLFTTIVDRGNGFYVWEYNTWTTEISPLLAQ